MIYRDSITVTGFDRALIPILTEFITGIGYVEDVREYDDHTVIEFSFEAETEWDACDRAHEVELQVNSWGISYTPERAKLTSAEPCLA